MRTTSGAPADQVVGPGGIVGSPCCANCKFSTVVSAMEGQRRECRRFPPQVTTFMVGRDRETNQPVFMNHQTWPMVADQGECGEHKPRITIQ